MVAVICMEGSTSVERLFGSASALHTFFPDAHPPRTSIQWEGMVRSIFPPRSFSHNTRGFFMRPNHTTSPLAYSLC